MPSGPFAYYRANRERFLADLIRWLRIPSVSALPAQKADVHQAAEFIRGEFRSMGMTHTELIDGGEGRNPLVYSEWRGASGKPTLLLYGHYDVQPPDPLEEWISPPFEPTIRRQNVYARGASDDKGQTLILVKAVEGFLKARRRLPVNVKFLIEGEEEVGGSHVAAYVPGHREKLRADAALICDTAMFAPGLPAITTGLRGLVYMEVEARGPAHDLHSGMYGGAAPNPLQALAQILAGFKKRNGRIAIPGFYSRVKRPPLAEILTWKRLPFNEQEFLRKEVGAAALDGERGHSVLERLWARPTFELHGICGGFTGAGAKTVIPATATAKVSMRLVPAMKPEEVIRQFTKQAKALAPPSIRLAVRTLSAAPASVVNVESRYVRAAAQALDRVFKTKTVYVRSGGSIPIAGLLTQHLKIPVVLMGFGLPDDNLHAPNEKFHLPNFYRGIEAVGRYMELLGQEAAK